MHVWKCLLVSIVTSNNSIFLLIYLTRVCIYQTPMQWEDMTQGQFLSIIKSFSFSKTGCLNKEPTLAYYLPIAGGRTDGFILSQKHWHEVKHRQSCPGFKFRLPIPYTSTVIVMGCLSQIVYLVHARKTLDDTMWNLHRI